MPALAHDCAGGWVENPDGTVFRCSTCHPRLAVAHARSTDPITSHIAAASVRPSASEEFVLYCLKDIGRPVLDEDLIDYIRATYPDHKIADSRIRTARGKLATEHHLVRFAGRGRSRRDKPANLWEAVPDA